MSIYSTLRTGIKAMIDEARTPESAKMGEEFENYVREVLFPENHYILVEKTHSFSANQKDFVEASLKPDFLFRDKWTNKEFYVEAKVRTGTFNNKIVWCTQTQLNRYLEYNKKKPVFLILDFGDKDQFISLIPLDKAKYTGLFVSYAEQFEIIFDKPVLSKKLWSI
jgi:hypothetical protein